MFGNEADAANPEERRAKVAVAPNDRPRNVLVAGFEKRVQLFAPVESASDAKATAVREETIPAAGSLRCGFDFNWELEHLASSTQPFSFRVTKKPVK